MSPKTGRPKADNPKEIRFSIRLDVDTHKRLEEYCNNHNIAPFLQVYCSYALQ